MPSLYRWLCVRSTSAQEAEAYGKSETTALRPVLWISDRFPWTHTDTHICKSVWKSIMLETNTFVTFIDWCIFVHFSWFVTEAAVSAQVHSALTVCGTDRAFLLDGSLKRRPYNECGVNIAQNIFSACFFFVHKAGQCQRPTSTPSACPAAWLCAVVDGGFSRSMAFPSLSFRTACFRFHLQGVTNACEE